MTRIERRSLRSFIGLLSYLLVPAGIVCCPVAAATYTVSPDGGGDFATIQAAVDAAGEGDIIELLDGVFTADGNRDIDFQGKAIAVRSRSGNAEDCVLACQNPAAPHRGFWFHRAEGPASTVEGVTVQGGHGYLLGGAVLADAGTSPRLLRCRFVENEVLSAGAGGGVFAYGGTWIEECTFLDNHADYGGALVVSDGNTTVLRCTFARNRALAGGAMIAGPGDHQLRECTFCANQADVGSAIWAFGSPPYHAHVDADRSILAFGADGDAVHCDDGGSVTLSCCDLYGTEGGDWTGCAAGQQGQNGNLSADPVFCDLQNDDYTLGATSPCAPEPNPGCGLIGAWPVGCGGPVPIEVCTWGSIKAGFLSPR